jgi:hypothetical protein
MVRDVDCTQRAGGLLEKTLRSRLQSSQAHRGQQMKFIIEKKDLTRLLRVLGSDPTKKAHGSVLRLAAQDGQIILHAYETEAGCEALVLEEGVCFFRIDQFLPLIRTYASAKNLTMEVTPDGIQIGNTKVGRGTWEVSLFQNPRIAPLRLVLTQPCPEPPEPSEPGKPEPEELPLWAWAKQVSKRADEI